MKFSVRVVIFCDNLSRSQGQNYFLFYKSYEYFEKNAVFYSASGVFIYELFEQKHFFRILQVDNINQNSARNEM